MCAYMKEIKALAGLHFEMTCEIVKLSTISSPDPAEIQTRGFVDLRDWSQTVLTTWLQGQSNANYK